MYYVVEIHPAIDPNVYTTEEELDWNELAQGLSKLLVFESEHEAREALDDEELWHQYNGARARSSLANLLS
ncbi:MAG: hypothetical protein LBB76_00560 [Azoarcus sp.]|jgi:hypothetical protein|nr:hypothetical protein [Azoarcus sp.]